LRTANSPESKGRSVWETAWKAVTISGGVLTLIVTDEAETMAQSLTIALSVPGQNSSKRDNKRVPDAETAIADLAATHVYGNFQLDFRKQSGAGR
jgi:hypothetical protein